MDVRPGPAWTDPDSYRLDRTRLVQGPLHLAF
jgi:hypothetical protein